MAVEAHITELRHRHKSLESQIDKERSRPLIDDVKITELKRKKLQIKDEINRLNGASVN